MRSLSFLAGMLAFSSPELPAEVVQKPGDVNLSSTCFDSLPYGSPHSCEILWFNKGKATVGQLFTLITELAIGDSLTVDSRDSADSRVLIVLGPQPAHGTCSHPSHGPEWLSPTVALHFDASRRKKEEVGYAIVVNATAVSVEGNAKGSIALALCYLARYAFTLDSLRPPGND